MKLLQAFLGMFLLVASFFVGSGIASAAPVTYTFEGDTIGQTPADTTTGAGTFDVQNDNLLGKAVRAVTQQGVIAALNFDNFSGSNDQSVVWKQAYSDTNGRSGFTLRAQSQDTNVVNSVGAKQGYLFHVYDTSNVYIWRVGANAYTALWSGSLAKAEPRWFRASAIGSQLRFAYSNDGTNYTTLATVNDTTYSSGTVQYTSGYGAIVGQDFIDDVTITNLDIPYVVDIDSTSPDRAYNDGNTVNLTVRFSKPVTVTGNPFLNLDTGSIANYVSGSGTDTLTFEYYVWFGVNSPDLDVYQINLNGTGTIVDSGNGNAADLSIPAGHNLADNADIVIDNLAPTVVSATVTGEYEVTVVFSEIVDNNTDSSYDNFGGSLAGRGIIGQSENVGTDHIVLTFDGLSLVGAGDGTMDISAGLITDGVGNPFAGATGVVVQGLPEPSIARVVYHDSDNSAGFSAGDTFTFVFNQAMDATTVTAGNVTARLGLSGGHSFGTVGAGMNVVWTDGDTALVVTLGSDASVTNQDTVDPTADVVSALGYADGTATPVTLLSDVWYAEFFNYGSGTAPDLDNLPSTPDYRMNALGSGLTLNEQYGASSPNQDSIDVDNFVGRYTKSIDVPVAETYIIDASSDDGFMLFVDGDEVLNGWQDVFSGSVSVDLDPGIHTFEVYYYENGGGAYVTVDTAVQINDVTTDPFVSFSIAPPLSGTSYSTTETIQLSFELSEAMESGSFSLTFIPAIGQSIAISLMDAMHGSELSFSLDLADIASAPEVVTTASAAIPAGTYSLVLSYRDQLSNPAVTAVISNVVIALPTNPAITPQRGRVVGGYLAPTPQPQTAQQTNQCPADQLLTQNLKTGARNGRYNSYTGGIVTQANILQMHLNRLGFNSGIVDGILGPISDGAIKRMQTYLGTKADGYVGPITRGLLNSSCGTTGLTSNS